MDEKGMRNRLRKILIFTVCVGICLAAAGLGFLWIFMTAFHQETHERVAEEAENYAKRIEKQVAQDFQMLNTLACVIGDFSLYDLAVFDDVLEDAHKKNSFVAVGFFDLSEVGTIVTDNETVDRNVKVDYLHKEAQEVVQQALAGEKSVSRAFYGDFSHRRILMFGVPVYDKGRLVGAMIASDLVEVFSEIVDSERIMDGNAYIHLMDSEGQFLIRSNRAVVQEEKSSIFAEPYLEGEEAARVKAAMGNSERVLFEFKHEGKNYHSLLEPLGFNGWYLLCINSIQNTNRWIYLIAELFLAFFVVMVLLVAFILTYGYRVMRQNNQRLMEIAYLDPLTGLYNLRRFRELVKEQTRENPHYAIAILNVRKFKFVNEIFGREQADRLLVFIGKVLQNGIGETEYVCRDSADSFYLYLKETNSHEIKRRLEAMMEEIIGTSGHSENDYRLKLHCGVAISGEELSVQRTMTRATFALVKAKEKYQETIWFFDTQLHEFEKMENYVERHMQEALEKEYFKLYLQPKIDLKDHTLAGAEALVRWIEDDGTMIYPSQFIPLLEENGFCAQLDLYMVRKVCRLLREWLDAGHRPVPISINQSKLAFYENRYVEKLCSILEEYRIPAKFITLEILEEMVVENVEELNERLESLKAVGFKISMDDFGSGYSSLNTLGKIKIDELKLDRGFLLDVNDPKNIHSNLILEEVVQLSKKMAVSTVVEGVETEADDALVKQIGCDYGQGYYYSRPVSAEDFTADILLKEKSTRLWTD